MPIPIPPATKYPSEQNPTTPLILDLPAEFQALCKRDGVTPEQVLRSFVADLCAIENFLVDPRDDGYTSSGSDERMLALRYYERCGYTMNGRERLAKRKDELTKESVKLGEQLSVLEALESEATKKMDALFKQHDADGDTFFEEEPWFAEYEALQTQQCTLCEAVDRVEIAITTLEAELEEIDVALYA